MPRPVPGSTHELGVLFGVSAGTWDYAAPEWDAAPGTWDEATALYAEDASSSGGYLSGGDVAGATFRMDADAETSLYGEALVGLLAMDADAGAIFYGNSRAFWECDADAGAEFSGHATAWSVSGLRMDADAGAAFSGHTTAGTLRMDADAGMEIWPRLRAIAEACLGAQTEPDAGAAAELGNYVF